MAGAADQTTSQALLKRKYDQPTVQWIAYSDNPAFSTVRKNTGWDGDDKVIALQTEIPQGGGSSVATAQTNIAPSTYKRFLLTRIEDFSVARVKGQTLRAASKNSGALLDVWSREMDGNIQNCTRSAAIHFWRAGTGTRGQLNTTAVSGNTVTLLQASDITNFALGMTVQACATDGGAPRVGTAVITGIDRINGKLTVGASGWTGYIGAIAASDYLVRNGDSVGQVVAAANTMVTGVQAYVPQTAPTQGTPQLVFGLDISTDSRLSGARLDGTSIPMQQVILQMIAQVGVEGAKVDRIWMHPLDRQSLVLELGQKVEYQRVDVKVAGTEARVGFQGIRFISDGVDCLVMSDINVPRGHCFVTQWDTWSFESLGPAPQISNFDKNDFLRVANDDSFEVRVVYYGNVGCNAPAFTGHIYNFGS